MKKVLLVLAAAGLVGGALWAVRKYASTSAC